MNGGLNKEKEMVGGDWWKEEVKQEMGDWMEVGGGYDERLEMKVGGFGENMGEVGVREGDKIEAEMEVGWRVD
ncbi:hypothetical protein [Bacillus altitudinis]|uniref:L-arabinose isomerase family protein n=1 Tax=Bacillus altitudinis TaxID=293387 RepID=UPI0011AB0966|nr:hypothetical protein [Bacillus altitudinis]